MKPKVAEDERPAGVCLVKGLEQPVHAFSLALVPPIIATGRGRRLHAPVRRQRTNKTRDMQNAERDQ
jgi:hypothetical protein